MTSILRDWLVKSNISWPKEEKLEDVFENGYLIGQLLCNLEIGGLNEEEFKSKFVNDITIDGITENYKLITSYLYNGGIDIKPKLLQDIASNVSGAIHRFIYDLKCFMDRKDKESLTQIADPSNISIDTNNDIGTSSFKSPPRITSPTKIHKYLYEDMQKRDIELKIRKLVTKKFNNRSKLKFQKYFDHRIKIENEAKIEAEFEKQLADERKEYNHNLLTKTLKDNHIKKQNIQKYGKNKWKFNQKIKKKRINDKHFFNQTQNIQKIQKIENIKHKMSNEIAESINEFEDILSKTIKIQKNDNQETEAQSKEFEINNKTQNNDDSTSNNNNIQNKNEMTVEDYKNIDNDKQDLVKENPLKHLETLRHKLPDKTLSMKETEKYINKIKINVNKQNKEILQRQKRRKKLISDEMIKNKKLQENDRKNEINNNIRNNKINIFQDKIKKIEKYTKIFKENSNLMKQKQSERRQKDNIIKLKRDRKHFKIKGVEFKTKLTIHNRKLNELKLKQKKYCHLKNVKYCKKLVNSMIDITYKSVIYRKLSNQTDIPKQLNNEWINVLFNDNDNDNNNDKILSNINANQHNDIYNILNKEIASHSDIKFIQNALMECMDVNKSVNKALINKNELNNYLNGKGMWVYNNNDLESNEALNNNDLGSIISEIISVSEGPDPKYKKIIPDVPISIAFIGKPFVGKSTQTQQLADKYALKIINVEECIKDAINSYKNKENENEDIVMTKQQEIGEELNKILSDGKEVSDELYIETIFDTILSIKNDDDVNGWILDGFPIRLSQAMLLETKLSGYIDDTLLKSKSKSKSNSKLSKKNPSKIAPPSQQDINDIPKIKSGLDFVFYLDVTDDNHEILLERAKGRLIDQKSGRIYHITDNPPPDDKAIKEQLTSPPDDEYVALLPEHFKAFDERKSEIKEWFNQFGNFVELNCDKDRNKLTEDLIEMVKNKIDLKKQMQKEEEHEKDKVEIQKDDDDAVDDDDAQKDLIEKENDVEDNKEKNNDNDDDNDDNDVTSLMPWDNPLNDQNMCRRLHFFWSNIENLYIENLKNVFDLLRNERRRILAYLASTREYFYNFLGRMDNKQKMIDAFQSSFNEIHPDMRQDDDTKDELHQRIEELSFELFEHTLKRKNEAIEELNIIKKNEWLSIENNVIFKININIIQNELNRYISTIRIINDYFALKNNKSISEKLNESIDLNELISNNKNKNKKLSKDGDNDNDNINDTLNKLNNVINIALEYIQTINDNNNIDNNDEFIDLRNNIINDEHTKLKLRLDRLHNILNNYLRDLNDRHFNLISKLDKWIGLRIDSENGSINELIKYIQQAIEKETQLNYRLMLRGENFLIDQDVIIYPMPNPIQKRISNHKFSLKGVLKAKQIRELIKIFKQQNVNGIIQYKSIIEILRKLSNNCNSQINQILPQLWNNFNESQLYLLLSPFIIPYQSSQYINWKLFIISLILQTLSVIYSTINIPSLDTLFYLKQAFNAKDINNTGKLNKLQFDNIQFWFDHTTEADTNINDNDNDNIWKGILFNLFEDNDDEQLIDYNQLLYHLCFNDQTHFGFEKVISLSENLNIIDENKDITIENFKHIQLRGISNVNMMTISLKNDCKIKQTKQNNIIVEYFNSINVENVLKL